MNAKRYTIGKGLLAFGMIAGVLLAACSKQRNTRHEKADDIKDVEIAYELAAESSERDVVRELTTRQMEAMQAENEVLAVVKADTNVWVAHEFSWWYRYISRGETHREDLPFSASIAEGTVIHERVYTLEGRLLLDAVRPCNDNEPFAYERMIPYLVKGDTLEMVVPWYIAYENKGNEYIPPKTNIRVLMTVEGM